MHQGGAAHLLDLLGLRVPLCAILVVFHGAELTKQEEDLGNDNAGEVLRGRPR